MDNTISSYSSSDEANNSLLQLNVTSFLTRKRIKRKLKRSDGKSLFERHKPCNWNISSCGSSSDEALKQRESNTKRPMSSQSLLNSSLRLSCEKVQLTSPQNKFAPLPVRVSFKYKQIPERNILIDSVNSNTSPYRSKTTWKSMRNTFSTLGHIENSLEMHHASEEKEENAIYQLSQASSIDINDSQTTMIKHMKPMSSSAKKIRFKGRRRAPKGGYLEEFQRVMKKLHMDQRCMLHQHSLGLNSGTVVRVIEVFNSFGIHFARVKPIESDATSSFSVVIDDLTASKIAVGCKLLICPDREPNELPDAEKVYLQPHKIRLI